MFRTTLQIPWNVFPHLMTLDLLQGTFMDDVNRRQRLERIVADGHPKKLKGKYYDEGNEAVQD